MLIFNPHNDLEMINSILQISKLRCRRMDQKFEARPLCLYVHVLFSDALPLRFRRVTGA